MSDAVVSVEIAYARPEKQWLIALDVPTGTTAIEALHLSGILAQCPELDPAALKIGLFERACASDTVLRAGDRVVIYRGLIADPKVVRRERAALTKRKPRGRA